MITRKSSTATIDNLVEVSTRKRFIERRKKKIITVLLPLFAGLFAIFFILFIIYCTKYRSLLKEQVCTSDDCIASANMFLQVMDRQKDPCTDFFAYACGNFPQEHPIGDGEFYRSFFDESDNRLVNMVTHVLNKPSVTSSKSLEMTKEFYASCMDTALLEELQYQPLYDLLEKVGLPKYPTAEAAEEFNLGKTLGLIQRYLSLDIIVNLKIDQGQLRHGEGNNTFILKLFLAESNPSGGAIQDREFKSLLKVLPSIRNDPTKWNTIQGKSPENMLNQVVQFMTTVMKIILDDVQLDSESVLKNDTEIVADAFKILKFAADFNKMISDYNNDTEINDPITFAELEKILNDISPDASPANKIIWKDYINELFSGEQGYWTYDFENDLIGIETMESFKNVYMFLKSRQPITILRFVWWHVIVDYAKYTTEEMYEVYRKLYRSISLKARESTRERLCVSHVRIFFYYTIAKEVKTVFGLANQTEKAAEMLGIIKKEFELLVYAADWLDQPTKLMNIEKARFITNFIGYQNEILDENIVDEFYKNLKMLKTEYLMNIARKFEWEIHKGMMYLRQTNETIFGPLQTVLNPIEVNAYYGHVTNAIYVPAGILQRPFYFRGLESLNYGAIGSILGHELTHGFDSLGSHYDKNGEYQENNWPEPVIKRFEHRTKCFIDQYSRFNLTKKLRLDGKYTLEENIADNGGMRESYNAYQTFIKKHGRELKLPGFEDFTHEQLLFLSFATVWCETSTEEYRNANWKDTHSPNRIRVTATLQNMKEFAQAYHCPLGSRMNPPKKCIIW